MVRVRVRRTSALGNSIHFGSELLVHCTVEAPSVRAIDSGVEISDQRESSIVASLDPRNTVKVGDRLRLTVDTLRMHAFDLASGAAIGRQ